MANANGTNESNATSETPETPAKPAAPAKKVPTKAHRVLQNLRHDGKHYIPGKIVELTAAQAKNLVERKVVEPIAAEAARIKAEL